MPHALHVGAGAQADLAIECPAPDDLCRADRAPLTRSCMVYEPCGHIAVSNHEGWAVDDSPCGHDGQRHLWVRERELVVPTLRCSLVELMADRRVLFFDVAGDRASEPPPGLYDLPQVHDDGTYLRLMIAPRPVPTVMVPV